MPAKPRTGPGPISPSYASMTMIGLKKGLTQKGEALNVTPERGHRMNSPGLAGGAVPISPLAANRNGYDVRTRVAGAPTDEG